MFQTAGNPKQLIFTSGKIRETSEKSLEAARGVMEDLARARPHDLGQVDSCEAFGLGSTISIIKAHFSIGGWCLIITHTGRLPSWSELAFIRNKLMDEDINMAIPFPKHERYIPFHPNSVHLWEVSPHRTERLIHLIGDRHTT